MKQMFMVLLLGSSFPLLAQRSMAPDKHSNKKDVFGTVDLNEYRPFGLQISVGATATIPTRDKPITQHFHVLGRPPCNFTIDPNARLGLFAEVGLIHYPKKRSKLSQKLKYIFVSYIDWGIGIRTYRGEEQTQVDQLNTADFSVMKTDTYHANFHHLMLSGRFALHKNFYIRKKYFIDNGLGINVDLRLTKDEQSDYTQQIEQYLPSFHHFQSSPLVHIHYELGFGFRLNRRSLLIPAVQFPIVGLNTWRNGASDFKWFDSNYYPIVAKIKWTYLFGKTGNKHCPPVYTNEQDKDTMKKH